MQRTLILLVGLALLLAALPAPAQTTSKVVPLGYATLEGPTSIFLPFYYTTSRSQFLYLSSAMAKAGGLLTGINFRRDGGYAVAFSAISRTLQIDFYQTPTTPKGMSTTFAANRGSAAPVTLYSGVINLPALPIPGSTPAPWGIQIAFAKPQPYVVANGNVLLEFICKGTGSMNTRYYMDSESVPNTATAKTNLIGMYCVGAKGEVFKIDPRANTWILGGKADIGWGPGGSLPTSITVFVGNRNTTWGPIKLPFDLAPLGGTSSSTDACAFYTNIILMQNLQLNQTASFGPIPTSPFLSGVTLYAQGLALVPGANPLGVITGPAFAITLASPSGATPEVNTVYTNTSTTATTGRFLSTTSYRGPIVQFTGVFN